MGGLNVVHERRSTQRAAQANYLSVQTMQGGKHRLSTKAFYAWDGAQFSCARPSAGKTENRIRSSANTGSRAESLAYHAHHAWSVADVKRFPLGKTVAEGRHHERPVAANCVLHGFDQNIQHVLRGGNCAATMASGCTRTTLPGSTPIARSASVTADGAMVIRVTPRFPAARGADSNSRNCLS